MHEGISVDTKWLADALHEMAQPLTAMQCRLFLATMPRDDGGAAKPQELESALQDALVQCERIMRTVRVMQQKVA